MPRQKPAAERATAGNLGFEAKLWAAKMNLAIRGSDARIAHGNSFHSDRFPDLEADSVLANLPNARQRHASALQSETRGTLA